MDDINSREKLAIHQPNFMPWMGYFLKMAQSDLFVLLDDVQFSKGSYTPRVHIHNATRLGNQWLTIPTKKHSLNTPINEIQLDRSQKIEERLIDDLNTVYSDTAFFNLVISKIELLLPELKQVDLLSDFNRIWIMWVRDILDIVTPMECSSDLVREDTLEQVVLQISKCTFASSYLSGKGGKSYIDLNAFDNASIDVEFVDFELLLRERFKDSDKLMLANKSVLSWMMLIPLHELREIFQD